MDGLKIMENIPRIPFAHLPTPIEYLQRLTEFFGGPQIFIKLDDQTGLAGGGNKTRKLEFLIAAALDSGAKTLVTTGAVQSNLCRQTAAAAARFGLDCILVLAGQRPATITGNLLLDHLLSAEIIWTEGGPRDLILQQTFERALNEHRAPYLIPYGGSSPIGAAGYVFAVQELIQQWQNSSYAATPIDWIVFASSSGGTHAGLAAGARIYDFQGQLLGISIDEPDAVLKQRVAELATNTLSVFGATGKIPVDDILVNTDYLGEGYGIAGEPEVNAILTFARTEGILLDPVYTGRAAAGLIGLIKSGHIKRDERVLFWHTGGSQALFADRYSGLWG